MVEVTFENVGQDFPKPTFINKQNRSTAWIVEELRVSVLIIFMVEMNKTEAGEHFIVHDLHILILDLFGTSWWKKNPAIKMMEWTRRKWKERSLKQLFYFLTLQRRELLEGALGKEPIARHDGVKIYKEEMWSFIWATQGSIPIWSVQD